MILKDKATIWIGGAAGDGIASTGDIFVRTCSRSGLHVYAYNSYQSVIRGGHALLQVQVGSHPVLSHGGKFDLLIALNQETANLHQNFMEQAPARGIIFNSDKVSLGDKALPESGQAYGLPIDELTKEFDRKPIMQNTVASGALVFFLGLDWALFEESIRKQFAGKTGGIADVNIQVARKGFDYAEKNFKPLSDITLKGDSQKRLVLSGNHAIALGAVAGGMRFYSAYPMTPASGIMHWLAPRAKKYGFVMKQCEDEIAAINMAIGAGFAGARAMTGTSGGGFSLMTEGMGLAGMAEIPVVVAMVQRGGPSTGLPTKTEQGDLFQVINASQGEYPKAVIAPLGTADAFHATIEALNLAERYQMPVVLLSDLLLSEHVESLDPESLSSNVPIDRGEVLVKVDGQNYKRYRDTDTGVSPRTLPGTKGGMHIANSDEHDEDGTLITDIFSNPTVRVKMMDKRMRKLEGVLAETTPFLKKGPDEANLTLVGWGSTYGILKEVRHALEKSGENINHIQFRTLWPFNGEAALQVLSTAKSLVCVENNFSGLLARLIRQETGFSFSYHIRKYDGEPFSFQPLLNSIGTILKGRAPSVQTLVSQELDIPIKRILVST